jgi:hypothetical protein
MADWTAVGQPNYIYTAYADRDSIRRKGGTATMHGMYDFRRQDFTPAGRGLYSTVVLREYDCEGRRVRLVSAIDFSGAMGTGTPVDTSTDVRRWEAVLPGALDDAFWQIACGAK